MKELNSLAGNAIRNSLVKNMYKNTKGQYMKESNTHACNATRNSLKR